MRLATVEVSGFRGFATSQTFDFDADAVVIVASNGVGKTSVLDAVLWGLTGSVPRLGSDPKKLMALFSKSGQMHVGLALRDGPSGPTIRVDRSYDGRTVNLSVTTADRVLRDDAAAVHLQTALNADAVGTETGELSKWFTRTVYLQQDQISDFVGADSDADRFNAAAAVLGLSDVAEFQDSLDRARTSWTTATNQIDRGLNNLRDVVMDLERQVEGSSAGVTATERELLAQSRAWEDALREAVPQLELSASSPAERVAEGLRVLLQQQQRLSSRLFASRDIANRIAALAAEEPPRALASLQASLKSRQEDLSAARISLQEAEELAAAEHREALASERERSEIQTLAELALRHLGSTCPVCSQPIEEREVTARLQQTVGGRPAKSPRAAELLVRERAQRAADLEAEVAELIESENSAREAQARRNSELADIRSDWIGLGERGDPLAHPTGRLYNTIDALEATELELQALHTTGERLVLGLSSLYRSRRLSELTRQLEEQRALLQGHERDLAARATTGELASSVLTQVRAETDSLVNTRLQRLVPLAQRTYSAIDPHPAFRVVQLVSAMRNRRGRLNPTVMDPATGVESSEPYLVLSNSQTSALAISLFIGMNLGATRLPLQACLLDDPLQNLDEVHLLGLVDVLRRLKDHRQIVITTHDKVFGALLARKMRPVPDGRTLVIHLSGENATNQGPVIEEVAPDRVPLKFVG